MIAIEPDNPHVVERIVALTRDMILIPGTNGRIEDIHRCCQFVRNHIENLCQVEIRAFEKHGIPSFVASPMGHPHPKILMCAHLDVVDHARRAAYQSHISDGRIIGPGAGDMKGALAILLEVFREVHNRIPDASLGIAISSDEETGGESGIGYLVREQGLRCGTAMIPDGGSLNQITVEEKGILHLQLAMKGRSAHAALPWLGENPIENLMDRLAVLRSQFRSWQTSDNHWVPTCAVTVIGTPNRSTNRIPSHAHAILDIRFPPPHSTATVLQMVRQELGEDIELTPIISAGHTYLAPDPLYMEVIQAITGSKVDLIRDDGGSDARFLCELNIPVLMSRPLVGNLHAEDEWIDIQSMSQLYRIYLSYLMQRLDPAGPQRD